MLVSNTMRFGTDTFTVSDDGGVIGSRQALLVATEPLDASDVSAVSNFVISGSQPSGTDRRLLFQINNKVYRFVSGVLTEYTGAVSIDNVLANGNTVSELTALSNITALVGKEILPIIALTSDNTSSPTIKLALNVTTSSATKSRSFTSGRYNFPAVADTTFSIVSITPNISTVGNGRVNVVAHYREDTEEPFSAFTDLDNLVGLSTAVQLQFKAGCYVDNIGSDVASLNGISVTYAANHEVVSGDTSDLFSVIPDFETDLRLCYLVVRHKQLIDSTIEAFANFFPTPKHRERILVGNGSGSTTQYTLGLSGVADSQIDHSSIKVFVDGYQSSDFDFNTETSEITANVAVGVSILASYDYDCGVEVWHPMNVDFFQQPYRDGSYMTRFSYVLPDDTPASLANIRLKFFRPSGSVVNQSLGLATGKTQQIVLPHVAKTDSIQLNADFAYDFDTRVLTFVAPEDTDLILSYDYVGEQHKIYSWAAGWAAA